MADNPYYVQVDQAGGRSLVRNIVTGIRAIDSKN